jgi:hypothetical protein
MQVTAQYSSELLMAVGLILGSLLLFRFTRNRVNSLPPEERSLGRPLWVATISILFLGIASALNFGFASGIAELEIFLLLIATLGSTLLMFAAIMILGSKRLLAIPAILVIAVAVFISVGNVLGALPFGVTSEVLSNIIGLGLFSIPFGLFTYLTYTTKRITSFALAVVSITYPLLVFATTFTAPEAIAAILAIRLWGPALLITAMILPESKIGGELLAYSLTISSFFYFMTYLLVSPFMAGVDVLGMQSVTFIALAGILSIGTAAYTFTRWRVSRNTATLTIGIYFAVGGFSWLITSLNHIEFIGGLNATYFALLLGILAPMLLNVSSVVALDWKQVVLLPALIFAIPFFLMLTGWTAMMDPYGIPNMVLVMAITGILQSVIPLALYGLLWTRMNKAGAPGRSRALFLALGILLIIFGSAGGNTVTPLTSTLILGAFVVWWLGITGRADQLLNTTATV